MLWSALGLCFFFQITFFFFLLGQLFSLGKDPEGVSVDAV